jgi:hypothetical protein
MLLDDTNSFRLTPDLFPGVIQKRFYLGIFVRWWDWKMYDTFIRPSFLYYCMNLFIWPFFSSVWWHYSVYSFIQRKRGKIRTDNNKKRTHQRWPCGTDGRPKYDRHSIVGGFRGTLSRLPGRPPHTNGQEDLRLTNKRKNDDVKKKRVGNVGIRNKQTKKEKQNTEICYRLTSLNFTSLTTT